jgi:hypothetical protein
VPDSPAVAKVLFVMHPDGNVSVQCQCPNQVVALGLIEQGKDLLKAEWAKQAAGPRIVPAAFVPKLPN